MYLADLQQRRLVPLTDVARSLPVDDSPAGRLRDDATILMFEWTPPPR
ncbi:hypothetical protein ACFYOA_05150 [Streptomyces iakyrus]